MSFRKRNNREILIFLRTQKNVFYSKYIPYNSILLYGTNLKFVCTVLYVPYIRFFSYENHDTHANCGLRYRTVLLLLFIRTSSILSVVLTWVKVAYRTIPYRSCTNFSKFLFKLFKDNSTRTVYVRQ